MAKRVLVTGGAGFLGKWFVLQAALQAPRPQIALAVVLVLTTVISAGYYLYVVMVMFMRPRSASATAPMETPAWTQFVMVACATAILVLGVMPEYSIRFAKVGLPRIAVRQQAPVDPNVLRPTELTRPRE